MTITPGATYTNIWDGRFQVSREEDMKVYGHFLYHDGSPKGNEVWIDTFEFDEEFVPA
jgi:hypothetical protein